MMYFKLHDTLRIKYANIKYVMFNYSFWFVVESMAEWYHTGLQINRFKDWSCTWGMVHDKNSFY